MHIAIRNFKVAATDPKESSRLVNEKFYPLLHAIPGFVLYLGMETDNGGWASVGVFETAEGAAESNKIGLAFAKEINVAQEPPEITTGTLTCHTHADNVHEVMTAFMKSLATPAAV